MNSSSMASKLTQAAARNPSAQPVFLYSINRYFGIGGDWKVSVDVRDKTKDGMMQYIF